MTLDPERVALREIMSLEDNERENMDNTEDWEPVSTPKSTPPKALAASFFLFGLVNNVLYVIILSAALDLVASSVPKGLVLLCNIAPSLAAKVGWPYLLKGQIRYPRRIIGCCLLSFSGMMVIAAFDSLAMRLLGICFASFSSGLGEITFLQLSTRYQPPSLMGYCVGYFASGTGAAGLVGAGLWWILRQLGVHTGIVVSSLLPFVLPITWYTVLPEDPIVTSGIDPSSLSGGAENANEYTALPTQEEEEVSDPSLAYPLSEVSISLQEKWEIVSPLLIRYMLPLFSVYLFEYIINQGVSPTLLYPVPQPNSSPVLSLLIKTLDDYYPLWQLVYQTFVFLSRSSISLGLPPLPASLLAFPAILQGFIFVVLTMEAARNVFGSFGVYIVIFLISIEGICGGLAYVNVYYYIGHEDAPTPSTASEGRWSQVRLREWQKQAKEFRIGSMGFADSFGILLASLIAMPTEIALCKTQVQHGKDLCKQL